MSKLIGLGSRLVLALSFAAAASTVAGARSGWLELAQAPLTSEEEKKRKEEEKKKGQPTTKPKGSPQATPQAAPPSGPPAPAAPKQQGSQTPDSRRDNPNRPSRGQVAPAVPAKPGSPSAAPGTQAQPTPAAAGTTPPSVPPAGLPGAPGRQTPAASVPSPSSPSQPPAARIKPPSPGARTPVVAPVVPAKPGSPPAGPGTQAQPTPSGAPGGQPPAAGVPSPSSTSQPAALQTQPPPHGAQTPVAGPRRFEEVQRDRKERVEQGGRRVIEEPGNRVIVKQDNRAIIRHDEAERFRRRPDAQSERRPDGIIATSYVRVDGMRVITEVDGHGRLVRRYRRGPDGSERNLIDNRRFLRNVAIGVGIGAVGIAILNLPPPRVTIAREKYVVEYERASDDDLYEALEAAPIERLERAYSLEEIRDNYELRQRMRQIEIGNIAFEFGAWEVAPEQFPKLERLARALTRILRRNPDEVFLIEGHTDAVGSDVDNLSLSDRRAATVAEILTETFQVPAENLVTQGYGEQFLKIDTRAAEPLNRRVAARRITPLMAER